MMHVPYWSYFWQLPVLRFAADAVIPAASARVAGLLPIHDLLDPRVVLQRDLERERVAIRVAHHLLGDAEEERAVDRRFALRRQDDQRLDGHRRLRRRHRRRDHRHQRLGRVDVVAQHLRQRQVEREVVDAPQPRREAVAGEERLAHDVVPALLLQLVAAVQGEARRDAVDHRHRRVEVVVVRRRVVAVARAPRGTQIRRQRLVPRRRRRRRRRPAFPSMAAIAAASLPPSTRGTDTRSTRSARPPAPTCRRRA